MIMEPDQVVQILTGDLGGVLLYHQLGVHISADVGLAILPVGGGTAEHIPDVVLLQVGEVLLGELQVLGTHGVGCRGTAAQQSLTGGGHGGAADDDGGVVLVLDHGGLQGVESHLSGVLTGQLLGQNQALGGDASSDSSSGDVDLPVVAHIVLALSVVAQSRPSASWRKQRRSACLRDRSCRGRRQPGCPGSRSS